MSNLSYRKNVRADRNKLAEFDVRDGMTGLFNHSSCYELLELEFRSHRRYGVGVAVLLLDVDAFKLFNDRNGHREGDRILAAVAEALREETRGSDICCRLGGDEFAVILRLTNNPSEACIIVMPDARSGAAALREARQT